MSAEERIRELNLTLPALTSPRYSYVPYKRIGNQIILSGQVPRLPDGSLITGKAGREQSLEGARDAARLCGLHMLSSVRSVTGSLDDVEAIKLLGMVNAVPEFRDHPQVLEACSRLLLDVLGEKGQHARSAVGVGSLPSDITVEIDAIFGVIS